MANAYTWIETCTGWKSAKVLAAQQAASDWGIPAVDHFLLESTLDSVVACVLLTDAVRSLGALGIPRTKLLAKLRDKDADNFWAAWAEIGALYQLSESSGHRMELGYEPDKSAGRHCDFRLGLGDAGFSMAVEFKALGLSDDEMQFASRWRCFLDDLTPVRGAVTHFSSLHHPFVRIVRQERRRLMREAERQASSSAPVFKEASCTAIVAFDTEQTYLRRLRSRIRLALDQLDARDPCVAAFHWSNGASIGDVQAMLATLDLPEHLCAIVMLGAVIALPFAGLHRYAIWHFRPSFTVSGFATSNPRVVCLSDSPDRTFCEALLDQLDRSASVRLSRLSFPGPQGVPIELLRRDGSRRIDPFNFIFTSDPQGIRSGSIDPV